MKKNHAITLIALIITIIILLILAGVSINVLVGDNGIILRAVNASEKTRYEHAVEKLNLAIAGSMDIKLNVDISKLKEELSKIGVDSSLIIQLPCKVNIDEYNFAILGSGDIVEYISIEEAFSDDMLRKTENSIVEDIYGNIFVIPSGFKVLADSNDDDNNKYVHTDYIQENANVGRGIVIIDEYGNQFVWIPVGKIYIDEASYIENKLSRYTFDENGEEFDIGNSSTSLYEELNESKYGNRVAYNINEYTKSVNNYGGYYIGRYESRDTTKTSARNSEDSQNNAMSIIKNNSVYNYITQENASLLSQQMYNSNLFKTDLANSYAWDTAIVFIQKFSDKENYSRISGASINTDFSNNGNLNDISCNIEDMAGNCREWTTESSSDYENPCTFRGGYFNDSFAANTSFRRNGEVTRKSMNRSFRTILYVL